MHTYTQAQTQTNPHISDVTGMRVTWGDGGGGGYPSNVWGGGMACIIIPQYFKVEFHNILTKYLKYQQK